jgi:iron complex transport system substrate-binding protein
VNRISRHAPELCTLFALVVAVVAIEARRAAISLSPTPVAWSVSANAKYPRLMVDSSGHKLLLARKPQRIASQTLGSDEILFGICAGDQVVGASSAALDEQYSNVVDEVRNRKLPLIKNSEQVIELRPDIVFVASYSSAEEVELLRSTHVAVFRLGNFDHIDGILSNIRAVGYAVDDDSCAAKLMNEMRARVEAVSRAAEMHRTHPGVMFYGTAGYTEGANTLFDAMTGVVGVRNVAAEHGILGSTHINAEAISLWQPDYLVVGAAREDFEHVRRAMLSNPAIADSPAGRNGRIIMIEDRYILCVSQYIVPAIEALFQGLYSGPSQGSVVSQSHASSLS